MEDRICHLAINSRLLSGVAGPCWHADDRSAGGRNVYVERRAVMGSKSIEGKNEGESVLRSVRMIGSLIQCIPTKVPRREFSPISRI